MAKKLSELKASDNKSYFKQFYEAILKFLGFEDGTLLDATIGSMEKYFSKMAEMPQISEALVQTEKVYSPETQEIENLLDELGVTDPETRGLEIEDYKEARNKEVVLRAAKDRYVKQQEEKKEEIVPKEGSFALLDNTPRKVTTLEDSNFSPTQLSPQLYDRYNELFEQVIDGNLTYEEAISKLFKENDITFIPVYTNSLGESVGLYHLSSEPGNQFRQGGSRQASIDALLREQSSIQNSNEVLINQLEKTNFFKKECK